jgi:hypothetical protein
MAAKSSTQTWMTPAVGGDSGSGPDLVSTVPSQHGPRHGAAVPAGHRRIRNGHRSRSSRAVAGSPDLGALARAAVVRYLHDASNTAAEQEITLADGAVTDANLADTTQAGDTVGDDAREAGRIFAAADEEQTTGSAAAAAGRFVAESDAWRAAAASVAALDRIESAAARVQADIAAALRAHADLQAGAGAAAEAAVRAAQSAWVAAGTAAAADSSAKISLRKVEHYVTITVALVVIAIVILVVASGPAH